MKLNYRVLGKGDPLFILHGLFGSSDNWQTLGKRYAEDFEVYLIDQRNHGKSPHSPIFDYPSMADDLLEIIFDKQLVAVNVMGHSMGAKSAMFFAKSRPELVDKLIVADMGVKSYLVHHQKIIEGLLSMDFNKLHSRSDVDADLSNYIPDPEIRSFLMKGLYWKEKGRLDWRMDVSAISQNISHIMKAVPEGAVNVDALFIGASKSDYLPERDYPMVLSHFPDARFRKIEDAGHWLHVDQRDTFFDLSHEFLIE